MFVLFVIITAVFANQIAPYPYYQPNFLATYQPPSWQHLLGTDALGRDMLSRVIFSLRNACIVGFGAELVELTIGLLLGAVAGYVGGVVDSILMRVVDVVYGFPSFLFSIILVVMMGHTILAILIAVAATSWVGMARIVRSQVIQVRQSAYIESAQAMGASVGQILIRYVIPNSMGPVLVAVTFGIPANMMVEAALSVVGLGIQPPTPDLGQLILNGQQAVFSYPYLLIWPALLFALTLLSFTYLGDGLRNLFDTKSAR
jgi:ABC-type dipeptide/oligopeptide/nickel transport system permease subunit